MYSGRVDTNLRPPNVEGEPNPKPQFEVVGPKTQSLPIPFIPEQPSVPSKQNGDVFWKDDVTVLWKNKRYIHFFPREQDTYEEKLNSVMRAFIYISFCLIVVYLDITYIWVALIGIVLTVFLYS